VGLQNYNALFSNPRFFSALRNTTVYTIGTLLVLIPLPLILAVLLDSGRMVKSTVFRVILFLPALTSLVVVGAVFRLILGRDGFLNSALTTLLGIQPLRWLEVADLTLPSLILLAVWRWTGINIMYFNAGLVNIPKEFYEAAAIDGAGSTTEYRGHAAASKSTRLGGRPRRFGGTKGEGGTLKANNSPTDHRWSVS